MRTILLDRQPGRRQFALVYDKGDEICSRILDFARELNVSGASFTGIGALSEVTLGYFDPEQKKYLEISIREQVEVLSLAGNIALKDGEPKLHAHIVVGKRDGSAHGGHLLRGKVWPTLELVLQETPGYLRRSLDDETGLALLDAAA